MGYDPSSGGIIALHRLAHNIALLGEQSFIYTTSKNQEYQGLQIDEDACRELVAGNDAIIIYPEIVYGNPMNAKHVMRWLLNTPGKIAYRVGDGPDGPNDLVYKFADIFQAKDESKVCGTLSAFDTNLQIFYDRKEPRSGSCYIIKKGANKTLNRHDEDSINIDDYGNKGGNHYLAGIFNRCETFICYDDACFLATQAALCGCLPIVIPGHLERDFWHNNYPANKYGIAYGFGDVRHAIETMPLVKENLENMDRVTLEQCRAFIYQACSLLA